jgi:hypothetical protein
MSVQTEPRLLVWLRGRATGTCVIQGQRNEPAEHHKLTIQLTAEPVTALDRRLKKPHEIAQPANQAFARGRAADIEPPGAGDLAAAAFPTDVLAA